MTTMSFRRDLGVALALLIGVPIATFALASSLGLGDSSAPVMTGLLTFCCGFATCAEGQNRLRAASLFAPKSLVQLLRLLSFPIAAWFSILLLGTPDHALLLVLWFIALFLGWFGLSRLLAHLHTSASFRVLLLGSLNAALCSTPFWNGSLLESAASTQRIDLASVLIKINPILTANEYFFSLDLLTTPTVYLEELSRLSDYADNIPPSSPWATIVLATGLFLLSLAMPVKKANAPNSDQSS